MRPWKGLEVAGGDGELVAALRRGESGAAETLFRRHVHMAAGLAARLMGRDQDVDDLVQEAFAQAFASLARLKDPESFRTWLGSIVIRQAYKVLRRRRLWSRLGLREREAPEIGALVDPATPPEVLMELRAVYLRIERLPAELRIPFLLRKVEAMPLSEIAEATQTSLATVKRRIAKAEAQLGALQRGGRHGHER